MEAVNRFIRNGYLTFRRAYAGMNWQSILLYKLVNPILSVIFFSLLATHAYGAENILPWVLGNAVILCSTIAFFGVGVVLIAERDFGTLKGLISAPAHLLVELLGKTTFYILEGLATVLIGLVTGYVLFGLRIPADRLPAFCLVLLTALFSACAMGVFVASLGLVTRDINLLLNSAAMVLMALSGVNFPVERLPWLLQQISGLMPLTRALQGARVLLKGERLPLEMVVGEMLVGVVYLLAGYLLVKVMERLARRKGTLDFF